MATCWAFCRKIIKLLDHRPSELSEYRLTDWPIGTSTWNHQETLDVHRHKMMPNLLLEAGSKYIQMFSAGWVCSSATLSKCHMSHGQYSLYG